MKKRVCKKLVSNEINRELNYLVSLGSKGWSRTDKIKLNEARGTLNSLRCRLGIDRDRSV